MEKLDLRNELRHLYQPGTKVRRQEAARDRLSGDAARRLLPEHRVQVMYVGPYDGETPTIRRLLAFAADQGYRIAGAHHEIYIGDPARAAPEKLKTVLRYGVRKT